jgi:hypothetical protein
MFGYVYVTFAGCWSS